MFGRLAMGFANVRAGTRVLMLVLVQADDVARLLASAARVLLLTATPPSEGFGAPRSALNAARAARGLPSFSFERFSRTLGPSSPDPRAVWSSWYETAHGRLLASTWTGANMW